MTNFPTPPRFDFEKIRVSTFTDVNLLSSAPTHVTPFAKDESNKSEMDRTTGRRGEELLYFYLRFKYPDRDIQLMNEEGESGQPFDIRMIGRGKQDRPHLIEVKTTRSAEQHTFAISVKEIECLFGNPDTYHIYRVYYCNDESSSTITILNHIKTNMERKLVSLCMTIPS